MRNVRMTFFLLYLYMYTCSSIDMECNVFLLFLFYVAREMFMRATSVCVCVCTGKHIVRCQMYARAKYIHQIGAYSWGIRPVV